MYQIATAETFDEAGYLDANPDLVGLFGPNRSRPAKDHFVSFGQAEQRRQRLPARFIEEARGHKLARLQPLLRRDMRHKVAAGRLDFLTEELRAATRIIETANVSANGYDQTALDLIARHKDGLVLDCGAGRRDVYYPNVVNYEIVAYDTTDVLGVGEALPFRDGSFDAVLSIAVLEHVRDPFRCAAEISRVLKPGGELVCAVPFLQPLHGYPHHYFNATHQGLRRLFEDTLRIDGIDVPTVCHPMFALHWILQSWVSGLPEQAAAHFRDQRVGDLIQGAAFNQMAADFVTQLPQRSVEELACGFLLTAHKQGGPTI